MSNLNVTSLIAAVSRTVRTVEYNGQPARVIALTRVYNTDIDDAWHAITTPDRLARWFTPITGDLRLNGRFQLKDNAAGTITACEPPRHFASTWEFGGETSWVELRLEPAGDAGTRLLLEHIAPITDKGEEFWNKYGPGAAGLGWDLGLVGLQMHVDSDGKATHEEGMAWMMSGEGKRFVTLGSTAWGDASTAAGTDPDKARAAADNTTAFYTGGGH